jgi:hypothetical protein
MPNSSSDRAVAAARRTQPAPHQLAQIVPRDVAIQEERMNVIPE